MQAMGVKDVQRALDQLGLMISIIEFTNSTATSEMAAENVGCELGHIVKSLGFMISRAKPVLILARGDHPVDERKLAGLFAVGRKKVRMMNAEQYLTILGYLPGGIPPFAHRSDGIRMLLDAQLQRYEIVFAAGGASNAIFPIRLSTLQEMTNGEFADIAKATG